MPGTVLIVNYSKSIRQTLKDKLRNEFIILESNNCNEIINTLTGSIHLASAILLNMSNSESDGYSILEQIRSVPKLAAIPIIAEIEKNDEQSELRALSLGASAVIQKQANVNILKKLLFNTVKLCQAAAAPHLADRDDLTGLFNRKGFFSIVEKMVLSKPPSYYILSCFDIDNFKVINDQYGTQKGDEVLRYVADIFRKTFEPNGGICCRIVADTFTVLYPSNFADSEEIKKLHKKVCVIDGLIAPISFSIGRYIIEDTSLSPSAMYDRASLAEASIKGRYDVNINQYTENMRDKLIHNQLITSEMEIALSQHQFVVWFQPQYNHSTGALIGAEALVRWFHPVRGMISPSDFIPVFEQNGFVYELDKYVWEESCRYLQKWISEGRNPLPISVNISRYDVFREGFIEFITGLIEKYAIPVSLLRLEITESAFAKSTKLIVSIVRQLIDLGFTIEIDDFGSGYSSLNTLKSVPAQVVKLDMRFLEDDDDSQRGGNIIESIVRMTKWLGISVIAEGVETKQQADFLKSIGCSYVQGYLYARPMPAQEYKELCQGTDKEERLLSLETVENLDNNAFWDPESMDTLIFNSYVGGACIFEYYKGGIELLRATDKYAQVIGSAGMTVEDALKLDWNNHIEKHSGEEVNKALIRSIETKDEVTGEYLFLNLPGCPRETYLRSSMRVIATAGEHYLVYCTNENITAQRLAEKEALKASEQAQAIMDDVGSGITASIVTDGEISFIFANDTFFEIIGFTREQFDSEISYIYSLIHPDDREYVRKITSESYFQAKAASLEYRAIRRDGRVIWVRGILSATNFTDIDVPVQLSIYNDITDEKRAEENLRETDDQLRFLNDTAHDLLAQPDSDKAVEDTLQKLLQYFNGNRAYVFEFNYIRKIVNNTYEVCAEGVTPEIENLQNVPMEAAHFWSKAFNKNEYIYISDVDALDDNRAEERELLASQNIKSLIAVPLKRDGQLIGCIGIDDPRQQHSHIERLVALGDYIAVMLTRRDLNAKIVSDSKTLGNIMDDMPGGFSRMRINQDGKFVILYINEGFSKLVNITHDEFMHRYSSDAFGCIHPDDTHLLLNAVNEMMSSGEAVNTRYRVRHGKYGYIWLTVFGRTTKSHSGNTIISLYYTDASEQIRIEALQKELLDNLPCGAALYEYDGKTLTPIHLNRRYWELVGREPVGYTGSSVLDAVFPDDRAVIHRELNIAIQQNSDIACDIRLLFGENGYKPFHIIGRIVRKEDDKITIYASYTPISEEIMSYQEMLPIALATVISSSSDLSFVKDRDLRYICCSPAFAKLVGMESEKDIIGKTDYDIVDKEYADSYYAVEKEMTQTGKARLNFDEFLPTGDNTTRYGSTSKYPLLDSSGKVIGIYGVTRDITAYHTAYEQLQLVTNSILGGIVTCTYSDGKTNLIYFNDGFCKLLDFTREEYKAKSGGKVFTGVFEEDRPELMKQVNALISNDESIDCNYRVRLHNDTYKWINLKASASDRFKDKIIINAVLFDVTETQNTLEKLRMAEEANNLAIQHSGSIISRFNVSDRTSSMLPEVAATLSVNEKIYNVPYGPVKDGMIAPESKKAYIDFYERILRGEKSGTAVYKEKFAGGWRWQEAHFSTIFSNDGHPVSAIVSFFDVTDKLVKEAVYKKWLQSLHGKAEDTYSLFRCNISKNASFDATEGSLLYIHFEPGEFSFDDRTKHYASECVFEDDREMLINFLDSDTLLAGYYLGKSSSVLDFREKFPEGEFRWLRLTVDLIEYPNSSDIECYLMFENIDVNKRAELMTIKRAETDPLTGVLNRITFATKVDDIISTSDSNECHALLMLDIDEFKNINDTLGHGVGDKILIHTAETQRSVLRSNDLVGRLGGDEFVMFMSGVRNDVAVATKARQICSMVRKSYNGEVKISVSIGIAVYPRDGANFEALYEKADVALYSVKNSGKDNYSFYRSDMDISNYTEK